MRLRFDETTLSKNPKNPISADVEPAAAPSVANYLDLMHLPSGALAWLFTRPVSQLNSAGMVGKVAHDAGNPVSDAMLLRADHNVLVLMFAGGASLAVYPDGAIGHQGQVLACTPEEVQSVIGNAPMEMPGVTGALPDSLPDNNPDNNPDNLSGLPETDPMGMSSDSMSGIDMAGMDSVVAEPEMADEGAGDVSLGDIGDPVEIGELMVNPEFYGDPIDVDPVEDILNQVGAVGGPDDFPLALLDDKGSATRKERQKR